MYLGLKFLLKWHLLCFPSLFKAISHKLWFPLPCLSLGRGSGEREEEQLMNKESPNSPNWFSQAPKVQKLRRNMNFQQGDEAQEVTRIIKM